MNRFLKSESDMIINMTVFCGHDLPEKTILLPEKIYSEYIENKEKYILARFPATDYRHIQLLSQFNVSSTKNIYCEVSLDMHIGLDLDFGGDTIKLLVLSNPLNPDEIEKLKQKECIRLT